MDKDTVLQGRLGFLSLGDIIQLLGGNGSSGTLRITSPHAVETGLIYFERGNPINAAAGPQSGLDALYALFGWTRGEFVFSESEVYSHRVINKSRMSIILDGLKMLDDGQIPRIGPQAGAKAAAGPAREADGLSVIKGPLVDYMYIVDEEDFYGGEMIVEEGKHGGWMWVVLEGTVDILKETDTGPLQIIRIGAGSFIGSLSSFILKEHTRSASAKASGNVQLGVMDSQRLAQEYAKMAPDFRSFILSLDRRLKALTNRTVEYYSGSVNTLRFSKNQRKFVIPTSNGDGRIYRILHGSATIVQQTDTGPIPLVDLHADDFFGRIPFLDFGHEAGSAVVQVSDDFKAQPVKAEILRREYDKLSAAFRNLIENLATYIAMTTQVLLKHRNQKMKW